MDEELIEEIQSELEQMNFEEYDQAEEIEQSEGNWLVFLLLLYRSDRLYIYIDDENPNVYSSIEDENMVYDVYSSANPFNLVQRYNIEFDEICDQNNISREGCRELLSLINRMISDPKIGKV